MMSVRRKYIDGPFGQVHIHIWGQFDSAENLFVCLPPSPYSGRAYYTLAPMLSENNCVVAVDYPQFRGERLPSIRDYAQTVQTVVQTLNCHAPVSLIGFHTGCLVAVEASLIDEIEISRLILIDVPYFSSERQQELKAINLGHVPISENLSDLQSAWDMSVTRQKGKVTTARSFEMFIDHIAATISAAEPFVAAFDYECKKQFSKVTTACFVIATKAGLQEESLKAANSISNSVLIEDLTIESSVIEASASKTAHRILQCL